MDNNDILIRLRYALEIKNKEMAEIFKLGDVEVTVPEVSNITLSVGSVISGFTRAGRSEMSYPALNMFICRRL